MNSGASTIRPVPTLIETLPDPQAVRQRLGEAVREAKILRQLLKVSERAARERCGRQVVLHA